jgi:hypothetical protein
MEISKPFSGCIQTCHWAFGIADKRCQSTPIINQRHCSGVSEKHGSDSFGQMKPPRCKRRWHSQTPVPSQTSTLIRLPGRLRNMKASPAQGLCPNACWTTMESPSMPRRMSTGWTASQMAGGWDIRPGIAGARLTSVVKRYWAPPVIGRWSGVTAKVLAMGCRYAG